MPNLKLWGGHELLKLRNAMHRLFDSLCSELYALLSALAETPLKSSTGS